MALEDTLAFLRERMRIFNPDIPVEPGSDFDRRVLVPLAGRLGPDLFTTDIRAFLSDLLSRNFPDLALGQLDALTEALILPMELALGPAVAEISRVLRSGSFARPDQLTIEEADALGANLLQERDRGDFARGMVRAYFSHPQPRQVDLTTTFLSDTGLRFVPTAVQSISASEMLMNQEGSLYYMTITVEAVEPGDQYNLEPHQITSVQGLPGVVKVTNPARFKGGRPEQTAEEFIESLPQRMGEQGMSQPTGIIRQLSNAFPSLTRIAVVGYGDPEMQRDLLQGESLGEVLGAGFYLQSLPDDAGKPVTRLLRMADFPGENPNFTQYNLPLVVSVISSQLPPPRCRDLEVERILDDHTLLVKKGHEVPLYLWFAWSIRKRELRVSKAPGLLPGTETQAPPDQVHVGGAVDVYIRTSTFSDTATVIDRIDDIDPILQGHSAQGAGNVVQLHDLRLGLDYPPFGETQNLVQKIWPERWSLQILGGPGAGVWEVLNVQEVNGSPTILTLYDDLPAPFSGARWRILDDYDIDLRAPTLLRWKGGDLETSQGLDVVQTTKALDWLEYGVEVGDVLEIFSGKDQGEYRIAEIFGGGNRKLRLDRNLTTTRSGVGFRIYRPNTGAPLEFPAIRLTQVDLLDPTGQPMQVQVPYGVCLGAVSKGLSNPGVGVKLEVSDALLGLISKPLPGGVNLNGTQLWLEVVGDGPYQVTFSGTNPMPLVDVATQINDKVGHTIAVVVKDRLGIMPLGGKEVRVIGPGGLLSVWLLRLFEDRYRLSTRSVRAPSFNATTFTNLQPPVSPFYDLIQVKGGGQAGAYGIEKVTSTGAPVGGLVDPHGLLSSTPGGFYPEAGVRLVIGSRSSGVVRAYFIDPVTVEMTQNTRFTHISQDGQEFYFRPDPSYNTTLIPAAPKGEKGMDGNCVGGDSVFNTNLNFRAKRIRPGDLVVIDYKPIVAGVLADPVPNLSGKTLHFSFEGQESAQTLTFVNDDPTIPATHVTRQGVLNQINRKLGSGVATLAVGNVLELNPTYLLSIQKSGTANSILGLSVLDSTTNRALNAGTYKVVMPGNLGCTLNQNLPFAEARMQYRVLRPGSQRTGATSMKKDDTNLYFMDVEVISDGVGDEYNLESGGLLSAERYFSDGYVLTTLDSNVTFSEREEVRLHLPLRVNSVGTNDDPEDATDLNGLQVKVAAESCPEVAEVQGYMLQDLQRDVNSNPLVMALTPHHVFFTLDYVGGPPEQEVLELLSRKIHALYPNQALSVDDVVTWVRQAGVSEVVMPLRISAVVVDRDRRLRLVTSLDRVSVSQQAAFYPTGVKVRRQIQ